MSTLSLDNTNQHYGIMIQDQRPNAEHKYLQLLNQLRAAMVERVHWAEGGNYYGFEGLDCWL